jgi:hypothetical protein
MRISKAVRGVFSGSIFILVVYSLLSEEYRFSRAMIVLGTVWATISIASIRWLLDVMNLGGFKLETSRKKNLLIVAAPQEGLRVLSILQHSGSKTKFLGFVSPQRANAKDYDGYLLGELDGLEDIVSMYNVNEVIFCSRDLSSNEIISRMLQLSKLDLEYKIAPPESLFIIGSNSIDDQGDLYLLDVDAITSPSNRRKKRMLDVGVSFLFVLTYPVIAFLTKKPFGFLRNIFQVFLGKKTWVGLSQIASSKTKSPIRMGVLSPANAVASPALDEASTVRLNELYVRDYHPIKDFKIIYKSITYLGS